MDWYVMISYVLCLGSTQGVRLLCVVIRILYMLGTQVALHSKRLQSPLWEAEYLTLTLTQHTDPSTGPAPNPRLLHCRTLRRVAAQAPASKVLRHSGLTCPRVSIRLKCSCRLVPRPIPLRPMLPRPMLPRPMLPRPMLPRPMLPRPMPPELASLLECLHLP